jgi:UDP-2,3-diacylglucosamine hydrolase
MNKMGNESSHSLFISDLHLCASRPAITKAFIQFLKKTAVNAEKLFILGDLFEYWAGDDDLLHTDHADIIQAIKALGDAGTEVFFIHGNRDFLIGKQFSKAASIHLLPDPSEINLYGKRILISHGDELCTDDTRYQAFRAQVRSPAWQAEFLSNPLTARKAQIEALRLQSEQEKSHKSLAIMDVNSDAVRALLRQHEYPKLFIHGHTHRPNTHIIEIDGHQCQRIVLGDWYEQGSCLRLDKNSFSNEEVKI